jgi:hypothetical protein
VGRSPQIAKNDEFFVKKNFLTYFSLFKKFKKNKKIFFCFFELFFVFFKRQIVVKNGLKKTKKIILLAFQKAKLVAYDAAAESSDKLSSKCLVLFPSK